MASGCAIAGGCPGDYIAVTVAALCFILLLSRATIPFIIYKASRTSGSGFWIPVIQVFASFNLLLSIVMSVDFLPFKKRHWWQSCYLWAAWVEGPFGFGLLLSCRITQAFQLYNIFVKRRLPPIRSYIFLPLILLPWIGSATFIQVKRPLNIHCHMGVHWIIAILCLHGLYVLTLVLFTGAIRHIEFRFDELRDLWKGIFVSASAIGIWVTAYILNEIDDDVRWLQVASRFMLLVMAGVLVLVFFSISSSQPLLTQISLKRKESIEFETMGQALGIPDSGILFEKEQTLAIGPSEPVNKLLLNKRFRVSFMAFADSCYAGESVHFFEEVHELGKIPETDPVRRIYMARHIIEKYIVAGAEMEVNISHRARQEILTTQDLAHPDLFKNAVNEVIQLMKTNLLKDYWSSMFFVQFKEEDARTRANNNDFEHLRSWSFSPRLSSVQSSDDPFNQEHLPKSSTLDNHG